MLNDKDEMHEMTPQNKWNFVKALQTGQMRVPYVVFKYSPFGGINTQVFVWKLPVSQAERDDQMYARLTKKIADQMPQYHSRAMRAEFQNHFQQIAKVSPMVFRAMYQFITGDASVSSSQISKAVDERVKLALEGGIEMACDLRFNNTGRPEKFDDFWNQLQDLLNEEFPAAVDERRHSSQLHMPVAISVRDLIDKVKERMPQCTVPSESWVKLQFQPKDPRPNSALNYTGKFDIVYKVQSRSVHLDHADRYYCMTLFTYLKEFAIKFRSWCNFFCEDDKHSVNIGEPGQPLASLDRGRKVMVLKGKETVALDHDFHLFKMIPSLLLVVDIPTNRTGSFYQGKVYVCLKDAIFETSTPLRHQIEKEHAIDGDLDQKWQPIEINYSDGGPDHNVRNGSVKVAHVCHFFNKNLDMMVAGITYPGGSYVDPAERIMPMINIALNGVALSREKGTPETEKLLKTCSSMKDVREIADKKPTDSQMNTRQAVQEVLEPVKQVLSSRISRMKMHDEPFVVHPSASQNDVDSLHDQCLKIDSSLQITDTTKNALAKRKDFMTYLSDHTVQSHYAFQIRKCMKAPCSLIHREEAREIIRSQTIPVEIKDTLVQYTLNREVGTMQGLWEVVKVALSHKENQDVDEIIDADGMKIKCCKDCKPPILPLEVFVHLEFIPNPTLSEDNPGKYVKFEELYGSQSTPGQLPPSLLQKQAVAESSTSKHLLMKEKVRCSLKCTDCLKPRCVYAEKKHYEANKRVIEEQKERLLYTCGANLFDDGPLMDSVVVRTGITCRDHVEFQLYSCGKLQQVCSYCGDDEVEPIPESVSTKYKTVLPLLS